MLTNLKQVHRYETNPPLINEEGGGTYFIKGNEYASKSLKDFKLTTKMSKVVKHTNSSVNKVLDTLNKTAHMGLAGPGKLRVEAPPPNINEVDTATMLNSTNVSIKNLNHSLMKLVAVQQESQQIAKGLPQAFLMMDRVPVYLEVAATGMPHPAKITIRADPKRNNGLPLETLNQIVARNVHIFVSTQTKNPSQRSNQLSLQPPLPRVFSFAPIGGNMPAPGQEGSTVGKDQFDRIYICVQYDMSNAALEELYKPLEPLFAPGEAVDS